MGSLRCRWGNLLWGQCFNRGLGCVTSRAPFQPLRFWEKQRDLLNHEVQSSVEGQTSCHQPKSVLFVTAALTSTKTEPLLRYLQCPRCSAGSKHDPRSSQGRNTARNVVRAQEKRPSIFFWVSEKPWLNQLQPSGVVGRSAGAQHSCKPWPPQDIML